MGSVIHESIRGGAVLLLADRQQLRPQQDQLFPQGLEIRFLQLRLCADFRDLAIMGFLVRADGAIFMLQVVQTAISRRLC